MEYTSNKPRDIQSDADPIKAIVVTRIVERMWKRMSLDIALSFTFENDQYGERKNDPYKLTWVGQRMEIDH